MADMAMESPGKPLHATLKNGLGHDRLATSQDCGAIIIFHSMHTHSTFIHMSWSNACFETADNWSNAECHVDADLASARAAARHGGDDRRRAARAEDLKDHCN